MHSQISASATRRLRADGSSFRKLVWLHCAVPVGVSAVLVLLSALSRQLAPEGGLSNMDTHTRITTVLTLLQMAATVGVLFWDAGLEYTSLSFLRNRSIGVASLTQGFSRFLPLIGAWIFRWGNYLLLMMVSGTVSGLLVSLVPITEPVYQELMAFAGNPVFPPTGSVLVLGCIYFAVYLVALAVLLVPRFYLHRLTGYLIMDDEPTGGLKAVLQSMALMRGKRWELAKLDLRFWWFYLGELAVSGISMGQLLFPELEAGLWLFPAVALCAQLALYLLAKPRLSLCYGLFYESLLDPPQPEEAPKPTKLPWKY